MNQDQLIMAFRCAGEIYYHLRDALTDGEVTMFTSAWIPSPGDVPTTVGFRWSFHIGERRYSAEHCMTIHSLASMRSSSESVAESLAAKWTDEFRRLLNESAPPITQDANRE